jgi:hypothetical protein
MQLKLKLLLLVSSFFVFQLFSKAQSANVKEFGYYIQINGIETKQSINTFVNSIRGKSVITSFIHYNFGGRFYILKSTKHISQNDFKSWIDNKYTVVSFKEGVYNDKEILALKKGMISKKKINFNLINIIHEKIFTIYISCNDSFY